ncbi:helix-turn-helix domain-containing protein [Streptomyces bullii]|uniref:Helix-turn-helix domain-containing protein n=1 Tax=Streptomyces bullii TaxID=349910 RepID=A0ABW0UL47_9ACTN
MHDLPDDDSWLRDQRRAIGNRVRQLRIDQNLTQERLYLAARISRYTLQRAEAGEEIQLSTLLRIARVLGVSLGQLEGSPPPAPGGSDPAAGQ